MTPLPPRSTGLAGPTRRGGRHTSGSLIVSFFFSLPFGYNPCFPLAYKRESRTSHIGTSNKCITQHRLTIRHQAIKPQRLGSYLPLSLVYNSYYKLSASSISSSKLDVGTFGLNQYNSCVLLAHHPGQTRNIQIYQPVFTRNTDKLILKSNAFVQKPNILFDSLPPKPQKKKRCTAMLLFCSWSC